jgi:hypothetical protein
LKSGTNRTGNKPFGLGFKKKKHQQYCHNIG